MRWKRHDTFTGGHGTTPVQQRHTGDLTEEVLRIHTRGGKKRVSFASGQRRGKRDLVKECDRTKLITGKTVIT